MKNQSLETHDETHDMKLLLRVPEVAVALGVGRSMVYRLVERGELPVVRIGVAAVRFDPADVRALIERRKSRTEVKA